MSKETPSPVLQGIRWPELVSSIGFFLSVIENRLPGAISPERHLELMAIVLAFAVWFFMRNPKYMGWVQPIEDAIGAMEQATTSPARVTETPLRKDAGDTP